METRSKVSGECEPLRKEIGVTKRQSRHQKISNVSACKAQGNQQEIRIANAINEVNTGSAIQTFVKFPNLQHTHFVNFKVPFFQKYHFDLQDWSSSVPWYSQMYLWLKFEKVSSFLFAYLRQTMSTTENYCLLAFISSFEKSSLRTILLINWLTWFL